MQLICISRGSYGYGGVMATQLARKLGYSCIRREELTDGATEEGIAIGKVETAILKRHSLTDALAIEVDRFKAYVTAKLCEKALEGGVVYHGRTGHLVLQSVQHVLRIKTIADVEERVRQVMEKLNLDRDKAHSYIEAIDDDIHRWVRVIYNVDWNDPSLYDSVINFSRINVENAATAIIPFTQLPEFQSTPVSRQAIRDSLLSATCRLAIGKNEKTHDLLVSVRAERGAVTVTYLPHQSLLAESLPAVLENVPGVESFICTVASTTILFIQEQFDPQIESFQHLIEVAEKWNAAIELVRLTGNRNGENEHDDHAETYHEKAGVPLEGSGENGGILEDTPEVPDCEEMGCGIPETVEKLIQVGRAGAVRTVHGGLTELLRSIQPVKSYSLIVIGDVFLSRSRQVRMRMKRELISFLTDRLRSPVIGTEDLKSQFLFGPRQMMSTVLFFIGSVALFVLMLTWQHEVLAFLVAPGTVNRLMAVVIVAVIAPLTAFIVGGFFHNVLKLIKLE